MYNKIIVSVLLLMNVLSSQQMHLRTLMPLSIGSTYDKNIVGSFRFESQDDIDIDYMPCMIEYNREITNTTIVCQLFRHSI